MSLSLPWLRSVAPRILPLASLFLFVLLGAAAHAQDAGSRVLREGIAVPGRGVVYAAPDVAHIQTSVVSEASSAAEALAANAAAMSAVQKKLRAAGIAERDLQSDSLQLTPRYSPRPSRSEESGPEIVGYRASHRLNAVVREIARTGELLDAVVAAGANQVDSITFAVAETAPLIDRARAMAVADARRRAEQLAKAEGLKVGSLRRIQEQGEGPVEVRMRHMRMEATAASTPIAPGELSFEVRLQAIYAIDR